MAPSLCPLSIRDTSCFHYFLCAPKLLDRFKGESEVKTMEEQEVRARSLAHNTLGVEGRARVSGCN
jgi:hypothetical protein